MIVINYIILLLLTWMYIVINRNIYYEVTLLGDSVHQSTYVHLGLCDKQ